MRNLHWRSYARDVGVLGEKKIVLHIGLPKTGTTTLQKFFFPRYSSYAGMHFPPTTPGLLRGDSSRGAKKEWDLYSKLENGYATFAGVMGPSARIAALNTWVEEVARNEQWPVIISNEFLSAWPRGNLIWLVEGETGPTTAEHPAVLFLSELRQLLPRDIALKIILTLRNQSDFLASLAAQLGIAGYFTSTSFQQLLARRDPYLDYYKLVQGLEDVGGAQHLLTLIFEDGIEANISAIEEFIGVPDIDTDVNLETKAPIKNRKRIGENSWLSHRPRVPIFRMLLRSTFGKKLRWSRWYRSPYVQLLVSLLTKLQGAWQVPVSSEISNNHRLRIKAVYSPSNKLLSMRLGRSLSDVGY